MSAASWVTKIAAMPRCATAPNTSARMRWRSGASSLAKGSLHQDQWLRHQCACQSHPRALSARQGGRVGVGKVLQFDFGRCRLRLRAAPAWHAVAAANAPIGPSESTRRAAPQSPPRRAQTRPRRCRHLPTRRVRFGHALQAPPMRQRLGLRSPKLADSKARAQPLPRPAAKPPAQCTGSENTGGV